MKVTTEGQLVQLIGPDGKDFHIRLQPGRRLQTHRGILYHDALIGVPLGSVVVSHTGSSYTLLDPSLEQLLRGIRRSTQIVYPKEIGYILLKMSIRPGVTVVEAGTGSGALTTGFASAVMPTGHVYSYEIRPDMQSLARHNLERMGLEPYVTLKLKDVAEGFDERDADALFLDLPTPWAYLEQAHATLRGGGFLGAILPTTNQVVQLLYALEHSPFTFVEVQEILIRGYKVIPARFRPADRMVGHTGYMIFARAVNPVVQAMPVDPSDPSDEEE
jgi:tRNA (adenine57-N1/adenine58-N1)-methyltransferase